LKAIFNNKNIDPLLSVVGEKVGNLSLYVCSIFQNNNDNDISKIIVGCNVLIPTWALKEMLCPCWQCEKCLTTRCCKPKQVHNVIWKWTKDKQNVSVVRHVNNWALVVQLTQDWKCVLMKSEGTFTKSVTILTHVSSPSRKHVNEDTTISQDSQRGTWEHIT
jgi:hypothetical protein